MLIVIVHGSRKPEWRASVEKLVGSLQEEAGEDAVSLACMEYGPPTLMDAVGDAVAHGATRIRVLPLFLTGEGHVIADIAPGVEAVAARFSDVDITLLPAVGQHPLFRGMLLDIIRQEETEDRFEGEGEGR
jgi:sirohydrochlorin cobaltochelatase